MLDAMFETLLTDTEVKAIAKNRKFPAGDRPARSIVKNFFLTTTGLAEAFSALTREEIAALHMIADLKEVDVSFFDRLYPLDEDIEPGELFQLTFTQRYRTALKEARERLVRRGVLLITVENMLGATRTEMFRFSVPESFRPLLPPAVPSTRRENAPGEMNLERVAKKMSQVMTGLKGDDPLASDPDTVLSLKDGTILWGKQPFAGSRLLAWQVGCWSRALPVKVLSDEVMVHPAKAVMEVVKNLGPYDWFNPSDLEPALKVMCFGMETPPAEKIMEEGFKWGLFARDRVNGRLLYAPRRQAPGEGWPVIVQMPVEEMIQAESSQVWFDPVAIAPAFLADLNHSSRIERRHGRLYARPDLEKLSLIFHQVGASVLLGWLEHACPAYASALALLRERWGKTIFHQGMLLARVTDLSLRMQIEKAFRPGADYVSLGPEWLALRQGLEGEVEKLTNKAGFVVKRVKP